jgi:hypothetical protein
MLEVAMEKIKLRCEQELKARDKAHGTAMDQLEAE